MDINYIELYEFIRSQMKAHRRSKIIYVPNPGNLGDALIRLGAIKFLNDFGFEFSEVDPKNIDSGSFSQDSLILYGGGGAWCHLWKAGVTAVRKLATFGPVIVLPSTYELNFSIDNVSFYCRELESMKRVEGRFCHDMAFYLSPLKSAPVTKKMASFFGRIRNLLIRIIPKET